MTARLGPSTSSAPRMLALTALAVAALAGCGSDSKPKPAAKPAPHCPPMLTAAHAAIVSSEPGLMTCTYATSTTRVRVTFDDEPQGWQRWERAYVERQQTAIEWAHTPSQQPNVVNHVGAGAFWVAAPRELVASDGSRLLTVRVLQPKPAAAARALATQVAPHGLGPPHVPVRTGP